MPDGLSRNLRDKSGSSGFRAAKVRKSDRNAQQPKRFRTHPGKRGVPGGKLPAADTDRVGKERLNDSQTVPIRSSKRHIAPAKPHHDEQETGRLPRAFFYVGFQPFASFQRATASAFLRSPLRTRSAPAPSGYGAHCVHARKRHAASGTKAFFALRTARCWQKCLIFASVNALSIRIL